LFFVGGKTRSGGQEIRHVQRYRLCHLSQRLGHMLVIVVLNHHFEAAAW
jgi:hypothetical protein